MKMKPFVITMLVIMTLTVLFSLVLSFFSDSQYRASELLAAGVIFFILEGCVLGLGAMGICMMEDD